MSIPQIEMNTSPYETYLSVFGQKKCWGENVVTLNQIIAAEVINQSVIGAGRIYLELMVFYIL